MKTVSIAVVSGKGGVGKTMLTAAIAYELSSFARTLLIDLDFFNRGLSALLPSGRSIGAISPPAFLVEDEDEDEDEETSPGIWSIEEVGNNLFGLVYPELFIDEMQMFETLDVDDLKYSLLEFVKAAAEVSRCEYVVLDCHGGPDNSSIAACMLSDYSILVSEPDKITFRGTLNFVRQLTYACDDQSIDLRLVFNKVIPGFSGPFLRSFYNRESRSEFNNKDLLGIFPNELYLTKEFERVPFVTSVYPRSLLAIKTRILLDDLLERSQLPNSGQEIALPPAFLRRLFRNSLGKQSFFFNLQALLVTMAILLIPAFGMEYFEEFLTDAATNNGLAENLLLADSYLDEIFEFVFFPLVIWIWFSVLFNWLRFLDRTIIFYIRRNFRVAAYSLFVVGIVLVAIFPISVVESFTEAKRRVEYFGLDLESNDPIAQFEFANLITDFEFYSAVCLFVFSLVLLTSILCYLGIRIYVKVRGRRDTEEGALEIAVVLLSIILFPMTAFL